MHKTFRLQWDRDVQTSKEVTQRIRFKRRGGKWREVSSADELPDDVKDTYLKVRQEMESEAPLAVEPGESGTVVRTSSRGPRRAFKIRRRRPTRAREIDRMLYLDHPWFNGWVLLATMIAAPSIAYTAWQGLGRGGWATLGHGLLLALAALMAYYGVCVLINSTEFRVDDNSLTVKHGPLPWFGNKQIPVDRIVQITTRMHRSRQSMTFSLSASLIGHPPVQLAEGINTAAEARSIERAIERHLGIEDWDG